MASAFCSSAVKPGLLGQLILATVAIHAARNSRGTAAKVLVGGMATGAGCTGVSGLTGAIAGVLTVSVRGATVTGLGVAQVRGVS